MLVWPPLELNWPLLKGPVQPAGMAGDATHCMADPLFDSTVPDPVPGRLIIVP
jgi:hypothetical protein